MRSVRYAILCIVSASGIAGCTGETTEPAPPPPPPSVLRWSDPATWPNHSIPANGAAVVIPSGKTVLLDLNPPPLASLTVEGTLRFDDKDVTLSSGWILVHGRFEIGSESSPYLHRALITLTGAPGEDVMGMGAKVLGAMTGGAIEIHGARRTAWSELVATAAAGSNQIKLDRPVDWKVGDHLVLASTDFSPTHAEEATIAAIQGTTVTLAAALINSHFGVTQSFGGRVVDERGEVGLLSHNITIQGDDASLGAGFGGHIMAMQGGVLHLEGVELTRMGQRHVLARYPVHWHLEGPVDGQYVKGSSIWHTFNRCVTVHGSRNATVSSNVCYDNIGHAVFLEDGAETGNLFEDNLAILTQRPASGEELVPSDVTPAAFWITNPANIWRRNVAAGSRGFGFWFALPAAPTGLSTAQSDLPRTTPLGEFSDNVAHSNSNNGLHVDDGPKSDLTTETVSYQPREIPGASSPAVPALFQNFSAWKHTARGVWLRGSQLRLSGAVLADNAIGATFASSETFLQDGVVIGTTANTAGSQIAASFPIRGYEFYDGRVGAERTTFVNFVTGGGRIMSALGFNRSNGFPVNSGNYDASLTFDNANQVFLENPAANKDGDKAAVILDTDGSVTGTAGSFVVANNPIMVTPACSFRSAWNAWSCAQSMVQLQLRGGNAQIVAPLTLTRDDAAASDYVGVPDNPASAYASLVTGRRYRVSYKVATPDRPQVVVNRANAGDWLSVVLPYPGIPFNVIRDNANATPLTAAASLAELDASTGNKYWLDAGNNLLYLKVVVQTGRTTANYSVAPK